MADKEATIYIVDTGKSMSQKNNGRSQTNFEYAMRYVWNRITTTIATNRKTLLAGVLALKSDTTFNSQSDDESYANINLLQPLAQIQMPELRKLQQELHPSHTDDGDPISALVIAVMAIMETCKHLKYRKQVVLVTNGQGNIDEDNVEAITEKVKDVGIDLMVLGVDFDDDEFGFTEEGKSKRKADNEKILRGLVEACNGTYGTLEAAIQELTIPRVKVPRPVPSFKGRLCLGNPEDETTMVIDVERYPRVMIAKAPSASSFVQRPDQGHESGPSSGTVQADTDLNADAMETVRNKREYLVVDEEKPGEKKAVERDDLAKGYEYGRTVVHISESDLNITKLETTANLELMGFIPEENYERYTGLGQTYMIIAQKINERAVIGLSSFIHALFETESAAVARLVTKEGREPQIVLLSPLIEPDLECLIETTLPFAEDVRSYQFPPLDKVVTVSGKVLTEHRNLPNEKLMHAMSDFVDAMDLSTYAKDDEGNPTEYGKLEDTYSPLLHRIDQAVRDRAVNPRSKIDDPVEILTRYSRPPQPLLNEVQPLLKNLISAAQVKKVPPKAKGRRRNREREKPLSGLDVDGLFRAQGVASQRQTISAENCIPEFRQLIDIAEEGDANDISNMVQDAVDQMSKIQESLITKSFGDKNYDRAVEGIGVMRSEMIDHEEKDIYNAWIRKLKEKILDGKLGGNRRDFWWKIRNGRLGLITSKEGTHLATDVDEQQAKEFLSMRNTGNGTVGRD